MSSPERSAAYGRVMRTMADLGPTKLLPAEQETIREAADALLFCADPQEDLDAVLAMAGIDELGKHLTESGRWTAERADQLVADVLACGVPAPEPAAA